MKEDYWYEIYEGTIDDLGQCICQGNDELSVKQEAREYLKDLYDLQDVYTNISKRKVSVVLAKYYDKKNDTEEVLKEIELTIF